ncbi:hypothetical protein C211_00442 [Stutzerimonas degradans]|nr:hypothetical protein C211_01936 [Stutzerimonas degradans]EKM97824.1 hypothetical protein C211_00442 [Stutzerimonas degradans]
MYSSITLWISNHPVAGFISLIRPAQIRINILCEIILIDKVCPRVIGRIDIYKRNLIEISFL